MKIIDSCLLNNKQHYAIFLHTGKSSDESSTPTKIDLSKENTEKKRYFTKPDEDVQSQKSIQDIIDESKSEKQRSLRIIDTISEYREKFFKQEYIGNFFRIYSLMMIPLASLAPSAVALYWASSGVTAIAVNLTLLSPKVKNLVRIPQFEKDSKTPYVDVINDIKTRWKSLFEKITK